jgi:hypothetical protein
LTAGQRTRYELSDIHGGNRRRLQEKHAPSGIDIRLDQRPRSSGNPLRIPVRRLFLVRLGNRRPDTDSANAPAAFRKCRRDE